MDRQEFINSIKDIKIKGIKGEIDILLWDETTKKHEAVIYGNYAVLKKGYRRYGITYVPTGVSLGSTVRMTEAKLIAKALNKHFPRLRKKPSRDTIKNIQMLIRVIMHSFSPVPKFVKEDHVN